MADDDVPVAVTVLEGLDSVRRVRIGDGSVFRLVRIVPSAARQPQLRAVAHGELDVAGRREDPLTQLRALAPLGARPHWRPGKRERGAELVADALVCFLVALVAGWVAGRMIKDERQI